jgi:hypothetical protein
MAFSIVAIVVILGASGYLFVRRHQSRSAG